MKNLSYFKVLTTLFLLILLTTKCSEDKISPPVVDLHSIPESSIKVGKEAASFYNFAFNELVVLNESNYNTQREKILKSKLARESNEEKYSRKDVNLWSNTIYDDYLTEKILNAVSSDSYKEFSSKLEEIIPWIHDCVPSEQQKILFDRLAVLKYTMISLRENALKGEQNQLNKKVFNGNEPGSNIGSNERTLNNCPGGDCDEYPLQQYQKDNTMNFIRNAPDGCYPVFDRTDAFAVREGGYVIIKHCPGNSFYGGNCSCVTQTWWNSWGKCAAGVAGMGGAGALAGASVTAPTVFGIPIGIVAGVVTGVLTGAATYCEYPQ